MARNYITWTQAEKEKVALRDMDLQAVNPKMSFFERIRIAQDVLPTNRRRDIKQEASVPWLKVEKERFSALKKVTPKVEVEHVTPEPEKETLAPSLLPLAEKVADLVVERILARLVQGLTGQVKQEVIEAVKPLVEPRVLPKFKQEVKMPRHDPSMPPMENPKPWKPQVLVVGLLSQQAREIEKNFGELFNLKFWKEEGFPSLKGMARSSDLVILVVDKITHPIDTMVVDCKPREVRRVNGCTSSVQLELEKYFYDVEGK